MARSRNWQRARERDVEASLRHKQPPLPTQQPPTAKQQRYLRDLARKTRTTFTTPRTRWEASQEIERLRALRRK